MNEKELLEYACLKFEAGRYGEALEAFILAYQKGYEKEWILQTLYECYNMALCHELRCQPGDLLEFVDDQQEVPDGRP